MEPEGFLRMRDIAFDGGRSGPAGFNAAAVDGERSGGAQAARKSWCADAPEERLAPEARGAKQKAEIAKWWPTIKAANVKVD
jgi:hypothetical protein